MDEILAVATSATREAENGGAFLRAIERRTGIRARIITGTEEARLIHLAAVYGVDTPKPAVVIDIGGGSVEITRGSGSKIALARSFKIGVIRLTERFVDSDPITSRDERKMTRFIREEVDRYLEHIVEQGFDRVIGTSGTILSLGTVATAMDRDSVPQGVRNLRVPAKSLRRLRKTAVEMDLEERMHLPGLDPRRADLMVAGAILLDTLLRKLGAEEITLCDLALREGVLLDYIQAHRKDIARVDSFPDVRRRSVIELAERCAWEAEHSKQVAAIALTMFDYTKRIHGLGDREREWLEYAGFLHDIGNHISYEQASSSLALPDQERRPARLRARRDRGDRAGDALSPPRHAEARAHRLRRPEQAAAADGHDPVGVPAPRGDARSQPARRDPRHRACASASARFASTSRRSATPSWKSGPRTSRPGRSRRRSTARSASKRCRTGKRPRRRWRWSRTDRKPKSWRLWSCSSSGRRARQPVMSSPTARQDQGPPAHQTS